MLAYWGDRLMLILDKKEELTNEKLGDWLSLELCPKCMRQAILGSVFSVKFDALILSGPAACWVLVCPCGNCAHIELSIDASTFGHTEVKQKITLEWCVIRAQEGDENASKNT
jgi:hypothetical protein